MDLRARIAALAAAEPALADQLALRGTIIELLDRAEVGPIETRLPGDLARARLAAGQPLLDRLDVPVPPAAAALVERLAVAMLADPANRLPAEAIIAALQAHRLHAEQLISEAIVGHAEHLSALSEGAGVPSDLVATLANLSSRPLLAEIARRLRPALALVSWGHGYCPVCGARPGFVQTAADGSSRLRCGRCATAWAWPLPDCPYCLAGQLTTPDVRQQDQYPPWSLLGCSTCSEYLKEIDLPGLERPPELMLVDLESWSVDQMALREGLHRVAAPAYRLEHGELLIEGPDDD